MTYYIGFFKYDDSEIWQKTSLELEKDKLKEKMENTTYVDKTTINIKEIELPN